MESERHSRQSEFTFHIVQIKLEEIHVYFFEEEKIYIPHSSDKTFIYHILRKINFIFTFHIVQIKLTLQILPPKNFQPFTFHIVQIKHSLPLVNIPLRQLFTFHIVQIKHIQDQTESLQVNFIYIPHSSDKTNFKDVDDKKLGYIYIPHSSDKTQRKGLTFYKSTQHLHSTQFR